jgi:NAD(P)-dependent dehydrogenase (short-subunit alcohol dehydrogenase family)
MSSGRKVMLIAGGSGSVGSAIAREAARQGWAVAIHGRSGDKLAALTAEIEGAQGIAVDIHAEDAAQRLVAETVAKFRRIDAVVDCTATGPSEGRITGLFKDTTPETYGAFLNLSAAWFQRLSHAAYPHLAKQGGTLIAFISDAGRFAAPRQTIIGSARAATNGVVRNLSVESARDGIRVHCLSPSYVAESTSAQRMGSDRMAKAAERAGLGLPTAEEIAPMAVFLCGDGASKITGQVISINGGLNA